MTRRWPLDTDDFFDEVGAWVMWFELLEHIPGLQKNRERSVGCGTLCLICSVSCCRKSSLVRFLLERLSTPFVWRASFNVQIWLAWRPRLCDRLGFACLRFSTTHTSSLVSARSRANYASYRAPIAHCPVKYNHACCFAPLRCIVDVSRRTATTTHAPGQSRLFCACSRHTIDRSRDTLSIHWLYASPCPPSTNGGLVTPPNRTLLPFHSPPLLHLEDIWLLVLP